jgi:hypothetical protein
MQHKSSLAERSLQQNQTEMYDLDVGQFSFSAAAHKVAGRQSAPPLHYVLLAATERSSLIRKRTTVVDLLLQLSESWQLR